MGPSPQSSAGAGPSSSPFAGTDPTLYSPEVIRNPQSFSVKMVAAGILLVPKPYAQGAFVNELSEGDDAYISRYQFVSQLPDGTNAGLDPDHELFSVQHQMKLYACFSNCVPVYARGVHLRYDDLHDAAEGKLILEQHEFTVVYISGYDFALAKGQETAQLNEFEGQIVLSVKIEPNPDHAIWEFTEDDLAGVTKSVEAAAGFFGAVRNCVHVDTIDPMMYLVFRIEYFSVDAANRAVQSLRGDRVYGMSKDTSFRWFTAGPGLWTGERALNSPHRTKPRVDDQGRFADFRAAPNPYLGPLYYRHPHDQHNRVRRERILDGSDVRTTVMLRNIPNKMDWMSLKAILDDVCFGDFDFLYLRIDFKSGCNVGYAFINFSDVHGMIALLNRVERRSWIGFRSNKAAEVSYATIQGREALVQKFRNSSVMQETPFCRPRLFFTYADADITGQYRNTGTEQVFPRPDNLSKLQRSMDSARTIGLYPPHGYSSVTEHRNRSSPYDRGTPRDTMQTGMRYAHVNAHVNPTPLPSMRMDDTRKRAVEAWYVCKHGLGQLDRIPFDCIPMSQLQQYFAEMHPHASQVPGVIGGPVITPTRGSRTTARTPARGGSTDEFVNNPFM